MDKHHDSQGLPCLSCLLLLPIPPLIWLPLGSTPLTCMPPPYLQALPHSVHSWRDLTHVPWESSLTAWTSPLWEPSRYRKPMWNGGDFLDSTKWNCLPSCLSKLSCRVPCCLSWEKILTSSRASLQAFLHRPETTTHQSVWTLWKIELQTDWLF